MIWNAKISENEYYFSFGSKFVPATQWQASRQNSNPEFAFFDQSYSQFKSRELTPWLYEVPSQLLRNAATSWFQTQWKFLRGECGAPRRKRRNERDSMLLTREMFRLERDNLGNVKLWIGTNKFPVGFLNVHWHRKDFGEPSSIRIKVTKYSTKYNKWTVSFSYEDGLGEKADLATSQEACLRTLRGRTSQEILSLTEGIDRGVAIPVATSQESYVFTKGAKDRMSELETRRKKWQRQLARQKKGSTRRDQTKRKMARAFERQSSIRKDFAHKTTHTLVTKTEAQVFVLENLPIQHMTRSARGSLEEPGKNVAAKSGLNREILNVGWHRIETFLIYKALKVGKIVFKIQPHYSSQECAICSHIHRDNRRSQSEFVCISCGHTAHADTNAAAVLKNRLAKMISDSGTELVKGVLRPRPQDGGIRKSPKSGVLKDLTTRQKRRAGPCSLEAYPA